MRLEGKIALITGGTSGIGAAMAKRFAAEGAKVAFVGRRAELGEKVAAEIAESGGEGLFVRADVTVEDDVRRACDTTAEHFGGLNVLVNNAAATMLTFHSVDKPLVDQTTEEFASIHDVSVYGSFWMCKYSIPHMIAGGAGGSIINISSIASTVGLASTPAYSAGKGAVNSLTRNVAVDYAGDGVRVNSIVLGVVTSEAMEPIMQIPALVEAMQKLQLTRFVTPEDVAHAGVYFASDESQVLTGSTLVLDGGLTAKGATPADALLAVGR